ncbi:MAG TPA: O-antigen ligase family protein [Pirellulales bacterium]|nr:O-antigen ligase family protein [Pirellulales bacterium]
MSAVHAIPTTLPQTTSRSILIALTIAVLSIVFFEIEHNNSEASLQETFTQSGDDMADRTAAGDPARRLAIPALGLFGILLLTRRDGWRIRLDSSLGWWLLAYLLWCGATILWSENPALTIRRYSVLLFCVAGALGVAKSFSLGELAFLALGVTTILLANSVRTELALGTFNPLSSDYRFSGTLHPNAQAPNCALMALSALFLMRGAPRGRVLFGLLFLAGMLLLVLTKSRTVCAAMLVGLAVFFSIGTSWVTRLAFLSIALWLGCTLGLMASIAVGSDLEKQVSNTLLMGREDEAESLSGRVPMWLDIAPHVIERLLIGHGYQTFWSPQRIESFSRVFQFTVPDGHCAYLDAALDLGLIGALVCMAAVVTGVREGGRRFLETGYLGYGFLFALFTCRSLNALLESNFAVPTNLVPFVMVCGLLQLGFCRQMEPADSAAPCQEGA